MCVRLFSYVCVCVGVLVCIFGMSESMFVYVCTCLCVGVCLKFIESDLARVNNINLVPKEKIYEHEILYTVS